MKRTTYQNKALHQYFENVANTLNDAGLDMKAVLKPEIDIPWSKSTVKEQLWRPIEKAMTGKESTTEMTTIELSDIYDVLHRHLSEKLGINVPFPSDEPPMI